MYVWELILQFFHDMRRRKLRTTLALFGIAWGTISVVLLLALGNAFHATSSKAFHGMGESIVIVWTGRTTKPFEGMQPGRDIHMKSSDVLEMGVSVPEIDRCSPELTYGGRTLSFANHRVKAPVAGAVPDYETMRNMIPEAGGRFIDRLDIENRRRVIFIGNELKQKLFGDDEGVGQTILVDGRPFTVIGTLKKKVQNSNYSGPDSDRDGTWIPISTFETLYNRRYYGNLVIKPHQRADMEYVKTRMREVIARRHGCDPADEEITNNWDTSEAEDIAIGILYGLQVMLGIIGGLTLIVAGVGIANVMYVSVSNATRDIGIRMAVGARSYQVLSQYVLEALGATAIGGLLGIAASQLVVWIVEQVPMQGEFFEFVGRPVPILSLQIALIVVAVLGVIGFLAGFFPARKAAQVDPAEALRYE